MVSAGRSVFVYRLDLGAGEVDVVSMIESEIVFEHGLCPEAIIGVLQTGDGTAGDVSPERFRPHPRFVGLPARHDRGEHSPYPRPTHAGRAGGQRTCPSHRRPYPNTQRRGARRRHHRRG